MRIVMQTNHRTCQQACIAMLGDVSLEAVIAFVGDRELGTEERWRAFDHFGIPYPKGEEGYVVGVVENPLVKLMREHPWRGMDPDWPWTRHIWKAVPIGDGKGPKL